MSSEIKQLTPIVVPVSYVSKEENQSLTPVSSSNNNVSLEQTSQNPVVQDNQTLNQNR